MVLPMEVARLCPDCDVLTEAPTCPQCGRARTFPLAEWVGRLDLAVASSGRVGPVPRVRESGLEGFDGCQESPGPRAGIVRASRRPPEPASERKVAVSSHSS